MKEPNKFHIYETEKITCKTSDAVEYIELFGFYHPRSSCTMHLMLLSERPLIYASLCMTISGERTEQLDIFCRVTSFTSDFLSFIDVELIRFFHGALQLSTFIFMFHVRPDQA